MVDEDVASLMRMGRTDQMDVASPAQLATGGEQGLMRYDIFFPSRAPLPAFRTQLGALFEGNCLEIMPLISSDSFDLVFADPPFNLGKMYGPRTDDRLAEDRYLGWCHAWIDHCIRALKPGGSFFLYNLPKWNILLGAYLIERKMNFRHSIAIDIKTSLPIPGRLYPSHYSLLYFTKGKPNTFRRIRTPIERCRHCGGEVRDYGGHRIAMNPLGVNLKDVWTDIPPVRHWKFKSQKRLANALSTKILDRVIEIGTRPGDIVLDPFGGSGTTFAVCERRGRRWLGIELDFAEVIVERLKNNNIDHHHNRDVVEENVDEHVRTQAYKDRRSTKRSLPSQVAFRFNVRD